MPRELDLDHFVLAVVNGRSPTDAGASLRTGCLLLCPIDGKVAGIEASVLTGLPAIVFAGWSHQVKLVVALALHQELGVDRARIHNMLGRQELLAVGTVKYFV